MENRNLQIQKEHGGKKKSVIFWKNVGIVFLALALSALTVVVICLNR